MKIGIIYCAYNCLKYAQESLAPFVGLRHLNLIHKISAVSVPFEEYRNVTSNEDGTVDFLLGLEKMTRSTEFLLSQNTSKNILQETSASSI